MLKTEAVSTQEDERGVKSNKIKIWNKLILSLKNIRFWQNYLVRIDLE
jgi:hypothetical protein